MKNFKKLIKEAYLGNPLNEDRYLKNQDSYIKVTEPRFRKDPTNPNFLFGYINYDTGPGVSIALGKETMAGQIKRLSSMEAMRRMKSIAVQLEDAFNIEDIEITDLKNGVVELFAVSDDFIDMDPKSELSMAMLNETAGTFGDGVTDETKEKYAKKTKDLYDAGKVKSDEFAKLDLEDKQKVIKAIVKYRGRMDEELKLGVKYELPTGETGYIMTGGSKDPKDWTFSANKESYLSVKDKLKPTKKQPGKFDGAYDLGMGKGHHIDEGTCGYGEDGVLGEEPAGPHLQKEESEGDKEIRALEKKAEKYPKGDSRREVIQKKIGDLKSDKDYALPGSKADKKFSDMSDKEIDDEVRRLLKRNFMEEEIETSLTPNEIGDEERANSGVVGETKGFNFKQMVKEALTPNNLK